jgi:hypothetical protein
VPKTDVKIYISEDMPDAEWLRAYEAVIERLARRMEWRCGHAEAAKAFESALRNCNFQARVM